jgi:hypothetical protein
MKRIGSIGALVTAAACAALVQSASAQDNRRSRDFFWARLVGLHEVPSVITPARGWFRGTLDEDARTLEYTLSYEQLEGSLLQAHLHIGQHDVNGGISVWLCGNESTTPPVTPPAGTPACPPAPGTVEGSLAVANVIGPATQGVVPMTEEGFDDLVKAIRSGVVYANVHTTVSPGGEIRGQVQ